MGQCAAKNIDGSRCGNSSVGDSDYCYLKKHQEQEGGKSDSKEELNQKRELFCNLYVSRDFFGNGTWSYIMAYGLDPNKEKDIKTAAANASSLLRITKVCERINELLDGAGLNDQFVDKQTLFLITQHDDLAQKNAAIREYNKIKGRITKNIDVKSDGEQVNGLTLTVRHADE